MLKRRRARITIGISLGLVVLVVLAILVGTVFLGRAPQHLKGNLHARVSTSGFVTRSGSSLLLNGQPFRFAGANIYWLGLQEDPSASYPSHYEVDDALATAALMGETVVRSHSLGISVGCSLCVEPTLGQFNAVAFQHLDYAIQSAAAHHIRLIIPLTDNWHYYHGGKHTFTDWRGIADENQFYSSAQVIGDFQQYVATLLNHVNSYTGIAYKDDPTILAWETGNELSAPSNWVQMIASYIKSIDANHLVMDGNYEQADESRNFLQDLNISAVDLYTGHYYPPSIYYFKREVQQAASAGKVFIVGEFDWNTTSGDALDRFLSAIKSSAAAGDMYWSLFPHYDTYGYVQHNEHYTLHYPGDTPDMRIRVQLLRSHAYSMSGQPAPSYSTPGTPLLETVIRNATSNTLIWQGLTGAASYTIERSTVGPNGPWSVICNQCATDNNVPWTDNQVPAGPLWYRVTAYSLQGVGGPPSPSFQAGSSGLLIDNLNNWSKVYQHSSNLTFDTSHARYMHGDTSRVTRWTATHEFIIWKQANMVSFQTIAYFWPSEPVSPFSFYTSADGTTWTEAEPGVAIIDGNWPEYIYTLQNLSGVNYVKVVWNNLTGQVWNPNLGAVSILY